MKTEKQPNLVLGLMIHPTGNHVASWMHPDSQIDAGTNFNHYVELAQTAERGRLDFIFIADAVSVRNGRMEALSRWPQYMAYFEPTTLMAGLGARTSNIGLVATATTSYNEPYNIARRYASIDHITGGRSGWNVVTSAMVDEARNFGRESHYAHEDRYGRAREFVEVVQGLWDSWEDDAFLRDRPSSRYFDPSKLHTLNHRGEHFTVAGPLNAARPPQGSPVIFQAGSSEAGKELAAATAEVVFTTGLTLEKAKAFYADVKGRLGKHGRDSSSLKIVPGLNPIVGRTVEEAREKHEYLQSLIHPDVGLELLKAALGGEVDLSDCDLDKPIPESKIPKDTIGSKSSLATIAEASRKEGLTIRQLYMQYAGARGQRTIIGTPKMIADDMEHWIREKAVDGFLIQPAYFPSELDSFVNLVIPELQERGLFRREYEGKTLRDNLGLERPASRYVSNKDSQKKTARGEA